MKNIATPIIKFAIDKVKRNRYVQNIFESPFNLSKFEKTGVFTDKYGNKNQLYKGLRSKIKPGWERMVANKPKKAEDVKIQNSKVNGVIAVNKLETTLNIFNKTVVGSKILEIGCHSGSATFALSQKGASRVIGSEFNGYKIASVSKAKENDTEELSTVSDYLKSVRARLKSIYTIKDNVEFVDDDICNSALEPNSFDIICSWEVLEHLHDPAKAFESINTLLKPGGISVHHYNPFFCINGGHSMCTLDFLWGHTRLDEQDFGKYIKEIRPNEEEKALSFFKHGVNRMTLGDLNEALKKSGMETMGITPFVKEQHMRMIDNDILSQSKKNYPSLQLLDLVTPIVVVISQKPL